MTTTDSPKEGTDAWYWCLRHHRVEGSDTNCPPDDRMGPYDSAEAAERWQERVNTRNETWDKEDEEWSGDDA